MKRWRLSLALVLALLAAPLLIWFLTVDFANRFGPMRYVESKCLLCDRYRTEKWLAGRKVYDRVVETDRSRWADAVCNPEHEHVWLPSADVEKCRWFGTMSKASGDEVKMVEVMSEHRGEFDADEIREIFAELNQIVGKMPPYDLKPLDEFANRVEERAKAKASSH